MSTCEGTYAATTLSSLPTQLVVGLDIHDRSPGNEKLAERFLAGLRSAGVAVGPQPNVLLHVTTASLDGSGTGRSTGAEQNYQGLSALEGGLRRRLPDVPSARLDARQQQLAPSTLFLRVDATEGQATRISWVASVQCRRTGTDDGQLAQDFGQLIGAALGRRIERKPF